MQTKPFWQSKNFWISAVLFIGGIFVGFPEEAATDFINNLFGLIGSGGLIWTWIKEKPDTDFKAAVNRSNWWNYLAVVVISFVPNIPLDVIDYIRDAAQDAVGGNWQGVLVAVGSLLTILYNLWRTSQENKNQSESSGTDSRISRHRADPGLQSS